MPKTYSGQKRLKKKLDQLKSKNMDQKNEETLVGDVKVDLNTSEEFSSLDLKPELHRSIEAMQFKKMTKIQHSAIPYALKGYDLMASAKTGSGKTLAFLIPIVNTMMRLNLQPHNGTGAIIISPTRELSIQTYGILRELIQYTNIRTGLIMGGNNRQSETQNLEKGVTILVATPGRLLDHLSNSDSIIVHNLKILVIDEADRMLDIGFELEMQQIIKLIPQNRQTLLFSATINDKTRTLAKTALKSDCMMIGVDDDCNEATVDGLEQGYVICSPEKKFCLLYTFLKKNKDKKNMVFMSSCMEVKFYYELLNYIDMPVLAIHGRQKQSKRTTSFLQFCKDEVATLLCTDVGARGLDIPKVDWILQYDPPDDAKEYIHRVGRTARAGSEGNSLLVLRPHEMDFLDYLKKAKVKLVEFEIAQSKMIDVQPALEKLITTNYYLASSAQEAFKGMVRAYASHNLTECFNVAQLDLAAAAKTCGLNEIPRVDLNVNYSKKNEKALKRYLPHNMDQKKMKKAKIYRKIK